MHSLYGTAFGVEFCLAAKSENVLRAMRERAPWGTEACEGAGGDARRFVLYAVRRRAITHMAMPFSWRVRRLLSVHR